MQRRAVLAGLAAFAGSAGTARAQTTRSLPPPVLTVDIERLFAVTAAGSRVSEELEAAARALAEENRRIEAELEAEERELTERRSELPPEEFRDLADAFDAKVQRLRAEQDEKAREVEALQSGGRQRVLQEIVPILSEILRERGALVLLDRRDVFLAADAIDITDEAIRQIDAAREGEEGAGDGGTTGD
jgi:Skp family chaperone for outer membrane proteins